MTVTGPGGVGKTRLAAEAARRVAGRFADGVWLVELASVPEPALVAAAVAGTLGLHLAPGAPVTDSLITVLARRQLLLVLDNCEHVLVAAGELCAALLPTADDVRIPATSREPLGVAERPATGWRRWGCRCRTTRRGSLGRMLWCCSATGPAAPSPQDPRKVISHATRHGRDRYRLRQLPGTASRANLAHPAPARTPNRHHHYRPVPHQRPAPRRKDQQPPGRTRTQRALTGHRASLYMSASVQGPLPHSYRVAGAYPAGRRPRAC